MGEISRFPNTPHTQELDWGWQAPILLGTVSTCFVSCLYHLVLLSILRYYAIKDVFKMQRLSKSNMAVMTIIVWAFSFLGAFNTLYMGRWISVNYYGSLMFYFYTIKLDYENKIDIICIS